MHVCYFIIDLDDIIPSFFLILSFFLLVFLVVLFRLHLFFFLSSSPLLPCILSTTPHVYLLFLFHPHPVTSFSISCSLYSSILKLSVYGYNYLQFGQSALMVVSWEGHLGIVEILLNADADPDLQDGVGQLFIPFTQHCTHFKIISFIPRWG